MTINSVLIRSFLLAFFILATFNALVDTAVAQNDDLVFDAEQKSEGEVVPLIETQEKSSLFHRIKRGFFDFWDTPSENKETTTESYPRPSPPPDDRREGRDEDQRYDDLDKPDSDVGDQQQTDDYYDNAENNNADIPTTSLERKTRESGEDLVSEHPNSVDAGVGDDEDLAGSGDAEGSAFEPPDEKFWIQTKPTFGRLAYVYRADFTINEPFRVDYVDRDSDEFKELSRQVTTAINRLYAEKHPKSQAYSNILHYQPISSDPLATRVSVDIESERSDEPKHRAILENQLALHRLGDIQATPENLVFRIMKDRSATLCDYVTEFECRTDSMCVPLSARCDGWNQCPDRSDEANCSPDELPPTTSPEVTTIPAEPTTWGTTTWRSTRVSESSSPRTYNEYPSGNTLTPRPPYEEYGPVGRDIEFDRYPNEPRIGQGNEYEEPVSPVIPSYTTETEAPDDYDNYGTDQPRCRGDTSFVCRDGSQCLAVVQKCDGIQDCDDGSDEENCPPQVCEPDEFPCDVSRCINNNQKCNFIPDCTDGSDEHDCPEPPPCTSLEWRCSSGQCIPKDSLCDGRSDCYDRSDEVNCQIPPGFEDQDFDWSIAEVDNNFGNAIKTPIKTNEGEVRGEGESAGIEVEFDPLPGWPFNLGYCPPGRWPCRSGKQCIPAWQRCDREPHCDDMSDEDSCESRTCNPDLEWTCHNKRCISKFLKCNGLDDCGDRSDEQTCPCTRAQFMCNNGYCIPKERRCDKYNDCQDRSDEIDCAIPARPCDRGEYMCDDRQCVKDTLVCDGNPDCRDNSDERDCPAEVVCNADEFRCNDGTCLIGSARCNGSRECSTGEDEAQCERECTVSEFRCVRDGKCINAAYRCDSTDDCSDHSDEEGCQSSRGTNETGSGTETRRPTEGNSVTEDQQETTTNFGVRECDPQREFRCNNGQCILLRRKCDVVPDCYDGSDETDCGFCSPDEWKCESSECIPENQRCDGVSNCVDGSDENDCASECPAGLFRCDDGLCLDGNKQCDGHPDCRDESDEKNCRTCRAGEWACANGACISIQFRCDDTLDCHDGSDERDCPPRPGPTTVPPGCEGDDFECGDGTCIPRSAVCDRIADCASGADERNCPSTGCARGEFQCRNRACVSEEARCNRYNDCGDYSDEENCGPPRPDQCLPGEDCGDPNTARCAENEWRCENGPCIPTSKRCDNKVDCPFDNSDELDCESSSATCSPQEWRCENGPCIPSSQRCDNKIDCPLDDSDELDCEFSSSSCSPQEWRCENGPCIPSELRCNGQYDCPKDDSDELDCPRPTTPDYTYPPAEGALNLKTYPPDQVIKEKPATQGREVVIQCRDEGPLRAKVHWIREDGAPLPPGSSDINGRLELPNIQLHHGGNYVCEALGVPPNTPGRRAVAHLTVEKYEAIPTRPPNACKYDEATCSNGDCIPKTKVCDGRIDCTDGSDESRCNPQGCEPNEFRCSNKQCVSKVWRCDGENDCADGSDEENCEPSPPGSLCKYSEFQCARNDQCILKSFHCDMERDCIDGSDEVGCSAVYIQTPPPPMVELVVGETFTITCTAVGVPTPQVNWRLNWGHIPAKCTTTSVNGVGTLTCPSIAIEDQGAYSCEGMNGRGWQFAIPDTILVVKGTGSVCAKGTFNSLARVPDECISCFCFGVATECSSADLFTYQIPAPFDQHNVVSVDIKPDIRIRGAPVENTPDIRPIGRNGVQVTDRYGSRRNSDSVLYFALPESYHGSQLKSYGGVLKYTVRYEGRGRPNSAPAVILSGNNYVLVHKGRDIEPDFETENTVRFFFGDWLRKQDWDEVPASREEIMMALANVDNILIKVEYDDERINAAITNIVMDTADVRNTDLGAASFVEECRCPAGYTGLSCEHCASGYLRRESGPWLGQCYKDEVPCQPGYYGDPSRNIPCQICPCPLTTPSNQFARTCSMGSDGQPICNCPQGYLGRRCEQCAPGYQGNPLIAGDRCVKVDDCDANGSISPQADPLTGLCRCKHFATGRTCNKCKANTFNLAAANKFGCVSCFCMGITSKCTSSNWYRSEIRVAFTSSIRDFSLIESKPDATPIVDGIHLNTIDREISYKLFPNRENNDVYYWQLPSNFLGDQLASYGGNLVYTVRYVPSPGGGRSRNNAADVELISSNDINLLYYSGKQLEPNTAETFTVPLLEDHWQRNDGTTADREHLLMALADIQGIRIKATYTTHTDEAALSLVSLDTAVSTNTGNARAVEVEECSCPAGYRGLSCEDCDVGYTRSGAGLYLGTCEPCSCNGHSSQCDAETGTCEYCRDHTTGENCDECENGYEGDATQGTPQDCQPINNVIPGTDCSCDPAGSRGTYCYNGQCQCKTNVEGSQCNRCRPFTFGLTSSNVDGCTECYCSGVTQQCHESSLYITQIPTIIYDDNHGFTLTDLTRRDVITRGFEINPATNQISYRYQEPRSQRLFWSLPSPNIGNQVKSYGGKLTLTQEIRTRSGATLQKDQDVLLIGSGITLYWTNPEELQPNIPLTYSVPLVESSWTRLTTEGPRSASRVDLMTVLSGLEAILVRATHSQDMIATYISDVSLDTAVQHVASDRRATQVEACRCPTGYSGTSCELCAPGYYRDVRDKSVSVLGSCNSCPCNGNEQKCEVGRSGDVVCHCLVGYTGRYCEDYDVATTTISTVTEPPPPPPPRIVVTIQEPLIQIVEAGTTVTYHCGGRSEDSDTVSIEWQKEDGQLPPGRTIQDTSGLLIIRDVRVSDSGVYVCQVSDGFNIAYQRATLTIGPALPVQPRVVIVPRYLEVEEGSPVEFRCDVTGNPLPEVSWIRVSGQINPEATFENNIWRLPAARKSDEAEYKCIARNRAGIHEEHTILYVTGNQPPPPPPPPEPIINPSNWVGGIGEPIRLACTGPSDAQITWTRSGNAPLPSSATHQGGILSIRNPTPADSGIYVCTVITFQGVVTSSSARISIQGAGASRPVVRVEPDRQTVSQGTVAEVRCIATGEPTPQITWTKRGESLGSHVQIIGNTLRIVNPQISDRGIYICQGSNSGGSGESSAMIEVQRRESPVIELYPSKTQQISEGGSALIQCRVVEGLPTPEVTWARYDGRPFGPNVEQLPGGVLRFNQITLEDGGSFVCSASNQVASTTVTAVLEVNSQPQITITPSNREPLIVRLGERVRLTCSATGRPSPQVGWSKHRAEPTVYSESVPVTRAFDAVFEISSVSFNDEGTYVCTARNDIGVAEERIHVVIGSNTVDENEPGNGYDSNLTNTDPGVRIPDENLRIPDGGRVEMRCRVVGDGRETIYLDWKRSDGRALPPGSDVRDGVLVIPVVTKNDAGEYVCQGSNSYGDVIFKAQSHLEITSPPRIELDPAHQTVRPGDSPAIVCSVTGEQPIEIQWDAIDRPLPYTVTQYRGRLQFNGITSADAGRYLCRATNAVGTAEGVAEVLVNEQSPIITDNQREVTAFVGSLVTLDCPVDGRFRVEWSRERAELPRNAYRHANVLNLTEVQPQDSGTYICRVTDPNGSSSSSYFTLRVELYGVLCSETEFQCQSTECIDKLYLCDGTDDCRDGSDEHHCFNGYSRQYLHHKIAPASSVSLRIRASQDLVNIGDTVDLQCDASGGRDTRIRWVRPNHPELPPNSLSRGSILRISDVAIGDGGTYRCVADTPEGTFSKDYDLQIEGGNNDAPAVETKSAPYGSGVVMDCSVDLEPPVRFQWNKLGGLLPASSRTYDNQLQLMDVKAEDAGTYICTASNGQTNVEAPQVLLVTGVVPNFSQAPESYMAFPPLPDASLRFNIEVSFKPENDDGVILYNGQSRQDDGDFLVLSLVRGYPEFRFNVGSRPAIIRAQKPITLGKWHTITLHRNRKEGTMLVDGEGPYTGIAAGRFEALDLLEPLYVGGVPDYGAISRHAGVSSGFVGCISRLVIGENQLDLIADQSLSVGVTTCETCAENPCSNNGACQESATEQGYTCLCPAGYSGKHCNSLGQSCYQGACGEGKCVDKENGFLCYCPLGKSGPNCEVDTSVNHPAFHDRNAFLAYQTPKAVRKLKLAMKFKPSDPGDGILMYCSQSNEGVGDFIALIIKDRHVELRFDSGSGMAVVRSNHVIQPGMWLHVRAARDFKEGKLSVNGEPQVEGRSPGSLRSMTLNTLLYIGGINRQKIRVNKNVGIDRNFRGCITELDISGQNIDILKSIVDSSNIRDCVLKYSNQTEHLVNESSTISATPTTTHQTTSFNPCSLNPCVHGMCQTTHALDYSCICEYGYVGRNCENVLKQCEMLSPCRNGGTCTDLHGGFKCDCRLGFNGVRCEISVDISYDVAFHGDGWLELDRSVMVHEEEKELIGFEISTNKSNGVIMWHGQTPAELSPNDYISLAVVDGYVEYQYNLGSGPAVIRVTAQKVDDGERHRIVLKRQGSEGSIELNGEHTESGASDGLQQMLNARGSVYLGGVPDYAMTFERYQDGFSGCIYTLEVQDSGAIDIGEKAIRGKNVYPCTRTRWIPSSLVFTDADADIFDAFVPPPPVNIIHPKPSLNVAPTNFRNLSLLILVPNLVIFTMDVRLHKVIFAVLRTAIVTLIGTISNKIEYQSD
ncbi:basement membrane-specific heparan sulfate proteoglycan core protein isoform X9 [Athalia rosae]|uniref:basement membrane-specific heparan sulfate proteoglycan core protein isoform X9 n=1 Tax=Athalia rosae TaxID=37344 RepID=UPI0020346E49|nr:basement membrane-specific heparan sulfate proteoglycan core protein isoform X9 [Athalia rosae]